MKTASLSPVIKYLGLTEYSKTLQSMQDFTANRNIDTPDQIWITEHFPVYTLGITRRGITLPARMDIPIVASDRGGKITYHGPGQLVIYLLFDLTRRGISTNDFVSLIEDSLIEFLGDCRIAARLIVDAPGVYIGEKKLASLGLRVRKGYSYHGLSLNVSMDLTPFTSIDPCGYRGLEMTQLSELGIALDIRQAADQVTKCLIKNISVKKLKRELCLP